MSHVFLSYASEDRERVRPLARMLEQVAPVWWDEKIRHGEQWEDVIEKAVAEAGCIVVVWTAGSVKSGWVKSEAADARDRGILVPVMLDAVTLPLSFRHIQTAHLEGWDGSPRHPEAKELMAVVGEMLARGGAGAPGAPPVAPLPRRPPPVSLRTRLLAGGAVLAILGVLAAVTLFAPSNPPARRTVAAVADSTKAAPADSTNAAAADSTNVGSVADSAKAAGPDSLPDDARPAQTLSVVRVAPVGGTSGRGFEDICPVREVQVNWGWFLDGARVVCADGTVRPQRGAQGGGQSVFALQEGEEITGITVWPGEGDAAALRGVQIHTSRRSSDVYGNDGQGAAVAGARRIDVPPGGAFRGFLGREGDKYITALGIEYAEPGDS